jgi:hypothetical protein
MTDQLRVAFASNMPAAAVEVVSPDLEVVDRFMLIGGGSRTVAVSSEASFLRVHLPSGRIVTLQDPGNMNRELSLEKIILTDTSPGARRGPPDTTVHAPAPPASLTYIDTSEGPSPGELHRYQRARSTATPEASGAGKELPLGQHGTAALTSPGTQWEGHSASSSREAYWDLQFMPAPYQLRIDQPSGHVLEVKVPGNARRVWARADVLREQSTVCFSVRIQTSCEAADTIASYLQRGDLYSAEAMAEWFGEARDTIQDPYAAVVGAYLLLRLRRSSQMHDLARSLAEGFPALPDGCVVWAWQVMQQLSSNPAEFRSSLLKSMRRGLPVYTEGLRLLTDGLRLMGKDGAQAREWVEEETGVVMWDSPVTAWVHTTEKYSQAIDAPGVVYDIAFAARA